jgi:HPt (histidine-containing phosphotransfer) domain-containing protein
MILIIADEQIIGADEEFMKGESLEKLKIDFPSMALFTLQNEEEKSFEFEYEDKTYQVTKYPIVMDTTDAHIYFFNDNLNSSQNQETPFIEKPTNFKEEETLKVEDSSFGIEEESKSDTLSLGGLDEEQGFNISTQPEPKLETETLETPTLQPESEEELNLSFGLGEEPSLNSLEPAPKEEQPQQTTEELNLDLGLAEEEPTPISKEKQTQQTEVVPDLDLDLDLGLDLDLEESETDTAPQFNDISISKEDIEKELENASRELGIDKDTILQFFEDFKQQISDEKEPFFTAIQTQNFESLHKSAHKLKGVALNLRLEKFGSLFKTIDELAKNHHKIQTIENTLKNLYQVLEELNNQETKTITISKEFSADEKKILFKSLVEFLEEIKNKNIETIKEELLNAYQMIPVEEFKESSKIKDKNELLNLITFIQEELKKEM